MAGSEVAGQVVVLYGPKAVGKSTVARVLAQRFGVLGVDTDALILDLIRSGDKPDPDMGWLDQVEHAVRGALDHHPIVSVAATGAYRSDWVLRERLEGTGVRVIPILVWADERTTMARLASRESSRKVPIGQAEAVRIYRAVELERGKRHFAAIIDTSGPFDEHRIAALVGSHLRP